MRELFLLAPDLDLISNKMNEKFLKLYNYLKGNDMTDLDEQSFYNTYNNPEKSGEIFRYLKSANMTDLNESDFFTSYFGSSVEKKNQNGTGEQEIMESVTEKGTEPPGLSDASSQKPKTSAADFVAPNL